MKATVAESCIQEPQFFKDADVLWKQLEYAVTEEAGTGSGPLTRVSSPSAFSFFLATADQIFTHELTLSFLGRLRKWGKETLDTRHASTPQIHIYVKGCQRALAPDAAQARWHYLYSMTRIETAGICLVAEPTSQKHWLRFGLNGIAHFRLPFNFLLVHETCAAYALDGPKQGTGPLDGSIFLHGYLW